MKKMISYIMISLCVIYIFGTKAYADDIGVTIKADNCRADEGAVVYGTSDMSLSFSAHSSTGIIYVYVCIYQNGNTVYEKDYDFDYATKATGNIGYSLSEGEYLVEVVAMDEEGSKNQNKRVIIEKQETQEESHDPQTEKDTEIITDGADENREENDETVNQEEDELVNTGAGYSEEYNEENHEDNHEENQQTVNDEDGATAPLSDGISEQVISDNQKENEKNFFETHTKKYFFDNIKPIKEEGVMGGSEYVISDETEKYLGRFNRDSENLMVIEKNTSRLKEDSISIRMLHDSRWQELVKNVDYDITLSNADNQWEYTYTVYKSVMAGDGSYQFIFSSKDEAGNVNCSYDEKRKIGQKIETGVDKAEPVIEPLNIKDGGIYGGSSLTVRIKAVDNISLTRLIISVNGQNIPAEYEDDIVSFELQSMDLKQCIEISGYDEAGNENKVTVNIVISDDYLVRLRYNTRLLTGGILLVTGLLGFILIKIFGKNEKKVNR